MSDTAFHPEDRARSLIDRRLVACGWLIQSKAEINLGAGLGVAVREFQGRRADQRSVIRPLSARTGSGGLRLRLI